MEQWIASYKGLVLLPAIEDVKVSPMKKPGKDQVSHILLSTVKYPTRTDRVDQNEVLWDKLTHDTDPEGCQTIQINILESPVIPTTSCNFPANR